MQNEVVVPYLHHCQNLSEGTEKTHEILVKYTYYKDRNSTPGHRELKSILAIHRGRKSCLKRQPATDRYLNMS